MTKITPPNNSLKEKARPKNGAMGLSRNQAVEMGNEVLASMSNEALDEIRELLSILHNVISHPSAVRDEGHDGLRCARQIGDTAGTFGFHVVTEIARSLETYYRSMFGSDGRPDGSIVMLHVKSMELMLNKGANYAISPADQALLEGLDQAVDRVIAKHNPISSQAVGT